MDNPYQSPQSGATPFDSGESPNQLLPAGLVRQVRVLAILNIVQGVLETLWGFAYSVFAFVMPTFMEQAMRNDPNFQQGNGPDPAVMFNVMAGVYIGGAAVNVIIGIVRITAGVRNYQFKSRGLGIASVIVGMGTIVTCYCVPTAIALLVYGLIVFLNSQVTLAFQMQKQGVSADKILETFRG